MADYQSIFQPYYLNGWENQPSENTPIMGESLDAYDDTLQSLESFLAYQLPMSVGYSIYPFLFSDGTLRISLLDRYGSELNHNDVSLGGMITDLSFADGILTATYKSGDTKEVDITSLLDMIVPDITETTSTTQPNSHAGREMVLEIGGESEQGEDPSPTSPQEIKNSKVKGIRTHHKNFLENNAVTTTENGGTFTVNNDGTVTVNGTFTASTTFTIAATSDEIRKRLLGKEVILSGCPSGGSDSTYRLQCHNYNGENSQARDRGNGVTFTFANEDSGFNFTILIQSGTTVSNLVFKPMVRMADIEDDTYEPYTSSEYTFSQPIDLYGKDGVQDVIMPKEIKGKYIKYFLDGGEEWKTSNTLAGRYYLENRYCKNLGYVLCTHAKGVQAGSTVVNECYITDAVNGRFLINTEFATVDEWKAHLAEKPMEVVYELAEEATEELPIADQIGLNSLATYDGITYVEFIYEGLEPTFKGKYGTSEVGGYTLEALLTARNNELRLTAVENAVVNNI